MTYKKYLEIMTKILLVYKWQIVPWTPNVKS